MSWAAVCQHIFVQTVFLQWIKQIKNKSTDYFWIAHFTRILTVASKWLNTLTKHKWSLKPLNSVLPLFQKDPHPQKYRPYKDLFSFKYRQNTDPILAHLKKYRPQQRWNWCIVIINGRVPQAPIAWYFVRIYIVIVYYTCFVWQELRLNKAKPNIMPCFWQKQLIFLTILRAITDFGKKQDFFPQNTDLIRTPFGKMVWITVPSP